MLAGACGQNGEAGRGADGSPGISVHEFGTPQEIGTGLLDGMTPDGSAAYVEDTDPRFPQPGCEGQPEPVMFLLPLEGGERTLIGDGTQGLRGSLLRGGSGGRVAVVSACEAFFSDLFIAREPEDGKLTGIRRVEPSVPEGFLLNPSSLSWSSDGSSLLGAIQDVDAPDGDPSQVVTIDPESGRLTKLFDAEQGTGVLKVGQLADGTYVVATNLVVSFRDPKGIVKAGFQGTGFEISRNRRQAVIYGRTLMLVSQGSTRATQVVPEDPGHEISSAQFSPDGQAVALTRYAVDGGLVEVGVATFGNRRFTSVVTGAQYGRAFFSGDGRALAFNLFGGEPDFTSKVYVTRFRPSG